jgi:hypothetical protein
MKLLALSLFHPPVLSSHLRSNILPSNLFSQTLNFSSLAVTFVLFLVMEHQWNDIDREKPNYSGKNLSQCHFVHHKSHMY